MGPLDKIDPGDGGGDFQITQNVGDLKAGYEQNDYGRISAYRSDDEGAHTGSNSDTVGRHGQPFGQDQ